MMPITVAVIQCPTLPADDPDARLTALVAPAAVRGARLVALPGRHGLNVAGYLDACRHVAGKFSIALITGSYLSENYLEAAAIGPDGAVIGRQRQTHLGSWERERGLFAGDSLDVFPTSIGRVGLLLGEDIRYPEVARILALQGAEVLVHLAATPAPFLEEAWLAQLWREVQANQTFGLQSCLVGDGHIGRSAVLAPVEMTPGDTGVLERAAMTKGVELLVASLDFDARAAIIAAYPILSYLNTDLYLRELLPAYEGGA
ncbi:MAG: Carbon-nitrogen hydrolase [bacterium ADurb.Bin429]|nr:MAG: Carbon-nitrogen hydrolase [bacterium ADurb.Bin429]